MSSIRGVPRTIVEHSLEALYEQWNGNEALEDYMDRHNIKSAGILTVYGDEYAASITDYLHERIAGKVVVEIGAGIGLLALHMSTVAKQVFAIEACPLWTDTFIAMWVRRKPENLTFIFGAAEQLAGQLRGDVAVFCTHSGHDAMHAAASQLAPEVIDVYRELVPLEREMKLLAAEDSPQ